MKKFYFETDIQDELEYFVKLEERNNLKNKRLEEKDKEIGDKLIQLFKMMVIRIVISVKILDCQDIHSILNLVHS